MAPVTVEVKLKTAPAQQLSNPLVPGHTYMGYYHREKKGWPVGTNCSWMDGSRFLVSCFFLRERSL